MNYINLHTKYQYLKENHSYINLQNHIIKIGNQEEKEFLKIIILINF